LEHADLLGAKLQNARLQGADLQIADLLGAKLQNARLQGANLHAAHLQFAHLRYACLHGVDLQGADLRYAWLQGADLQGADLQRAELRDSDLRGAKNIPALALAQFQIIPEEGSFVGWKKCRYGVLVKLLIPAEAKRSHGTNRHCRTDMAHVLEVIGAAEGIGTLEDLVYRAGELVRSDGFDDDRWNTWAPGIHFYLTRAEAEAES
jgi:hypothetical protein